MGTGMPHAFDAVSDNDQARVLIKETISFWKNHLDPVPAPSWKYSKGRDVLGSLQMDRPRAMELLRSLVEEYPNDTQTLLFYANQLRQDKKYDESISAYNKVLGVAPDNTEALVTLAVLAYIQNKEKEAEAWVKKAEATGRIKRDDYARMAFFLLVANKNKESAGYYEKAIAISPSSFDSYQLACAYAKLNDVDNAVRSLDYALKHGYGSKRQIDNDKDFNSIRSHEKFKDLVANVK
jgi:tetratricopeptide (TPR) repeat protein